LNWEAAYGSSYQIQVSNNATNWTTIFSTTSGNGGVDDLTGLSGSGRYLRMLGTARATSFGYSLWDFEVFASSSAPAAAPSHTPAPTNALLVVPSPTPTSTTTLAPTATSTPLVLPSPTPTQLPPTDTPTQPPTEATSPTVSP
jgi:hypothetical protein